MKARIGGADLPAPPHVLDVFIERARLRMVPGILRRETLCDYCALRIPAGDLAWAATLSTPDDRVLRRPWEREWLRRPHRGDNAGS